MPWPARLVIVVLVAILVAAFAFWASLPEKKKEQVFDIFVRSSASDHDGSVRVSRPTAAATRLSVAQMKARTVELQTTVGSIEIELMPEIAPNHVRNFIHLVESGFYNGTKFHRVIRNFTIQAGDPNTIDNDRSMWGVGGAAGTLRAELSNTPHERGTVSMARGIHPNSASSQFFICLSRQPVLDGQYTLFGRVVRGMDVVDTIASGAHDSIDQPYDPVTIKKAIVREKQ